MRRPCARGLALVLAVCVAASAAPVGALEVPYLSGRVVDEAGMLSAGAEQRLTDRLSALEQETGAQVAVLTVPSLEGDPIEDFSIRVVDTWKLGRKGVDDGVLVLVARDERRMRIEVGYGLEGAITDAQAGRVIDAVMAPRFREGDFDGGVEAAVEVLGSAIRGEGLPLPERAERPAGTDPGGLVFFLLFGLPFISAALRTRGAAGWILGLFLTPFFFGFPAIIFGATAGLVVAGVWLLAFPVLRLILPQAPSGRAGRSRGGVFWGPFIGGGGGGLSGGFGGFSGGGGGFGGGGASGGW